MKIRSWASKIDRWQHMPCKSHRYWIQSQQLRHLMYHWPFGHVVEYLVTVSSLTNQICMNIWNHASWLSLFIKVCTYLLAEMLYRTHSKLRPPFLLVRFSYKYGGGVRYIRFIGDGHSSIYPALIAGIPTWGYAIRNVRIMPPSVTVQHWRS